MLPETKVAVLLDALSTLQSRCTPASRNSHGKLTALGYFQEEVAGRCEEVKQRVNRPEPARVEQPASTFRPECSYAWEGFDVQKVERVMKRLYSEQAMSADEMRDFAALLNLFLKEAVDITGERP